MAIQLSRASLSDAPQSKKRQVPIEAILSVMGKNPYAEALNDVGPVLSQALEKRRALRDQANAIGQMASAAGEQAPTDTKGLTPESYGSLLTIKTGRAKASQEADYQKREEARKNADLGLKVLQAQNGYSAIGPDGKTQTYPGMQGIKLNLDATGMPSLDTSGYKPGLKPMSVGGGGGGMGGSKDPLGALQQDLDPNNPRGGMTKNMERANAVDRVLALMDQAKDNPNVLQSREAAASVASLIQGGSSSRIAQQQLDHLTPSSLHGDVMKQVGYVLNQPVGLGQQEFFKSLRDTANRERTVVQGQIKSTQKSRLARHERTRQLFPEAYAATLQNFGLDPTKVKSGRYVEEQSSETPEQRKARLLQELSGAQ